MTSATILVYLLERYHYQCSYKALFNIFNYGKVHYIERVSDNKVMLSQTQSIMFNLMLDSIARFYCGSGLKSGNVQEVRGQTSRPVMGLCPLCVAGNTRTDKLIETNNVSSYVSLKSYARSIGALWPYLNMYIN
jgi:hypothetical protein